MKDLSPLTCGDIIAFLSSYPEDSRIWIEHLAEGDWSKDFMTAPSTVGEVLEHSLTKPDRSCPIVQTPLGPGTIVGILFRVNGPILTLAPA